MLLGDTFAALDIPDGLIARNITLDLDAPSSVDVANGPVRADFDTRLISGSMCPIAGSEVDYELPEALTVLLHVSIQYLTRGLPGHGSTRAT